MGRGSGASSFPPGRSPAAGGAIAGGIGALTSDEDASAGDMAPTPDDTGHDPGEGALADAGALSSEGDAFAGEMTPVADDIAAIAGKLAPVAGERNDAAAGEMTPMPGDVTLIASERPIASTTDAFPGEVAPNAGEMTPVAGMLRHVSWFRGWRPHWSYPLLMGR